MIIRVGVLTLVLILQSTNAYAADAPGTEKLNSVIDFLCGWFQKIGLVVARVGGVQFELAFKNHDANTIRMIAAGFMVWGVGSSKNIFMG